MFVYFYPQPKEKQRIQKKGDGKILSYHKPKPVRTATTTVSAQQNSSEIETFASTGKSKSNTAKNINRKGTINQKN